MIGYWDVFSWGHFEESKPPPSSSENGDLPVNGLILGLVKRTTLCISSLMNLLPVTIVELLVKQYTFVTCLVGNQRT